MKATKLKVKKNFNITLPSNLIDELELNIGDEISIKSHDDGFLIEKENSEFAKWAEAYRSANQDYGDVLKELAK